MDSKKIANKRICIFPKDIQIVTGRSERYSRKLISEMKLHFCKEKHQLITIKEFCDYMGFEEEEIKRGLI